VPPAVEHPRAEQAGEQEDEERRGGGFVDVQAAEDHERRNQQDAARPDGAGEEPDDDCNCREEEFGDQPAAKATSSLVSSTASFFISAYPSEGSVSIRPVSPKPSIATTAQAVRQ